MAFKTVVRTARYESGPGDPTWERQSKERTRFSLDDQRSPYALDAELELVRDESMKDGRIDRPAHVAAVAKRMYGAGKIHLRANVREALEAARAAVDEYDARGIAAERAVINKTIENGLDAANVDDLMAVILNLGQNKFLPRSAADVAQERDLQTVAQKELTKDTLIRSIMLNRKNTYEKWSPEHAKIVYVDAASLEQRADETLDAHLLRLAQIEQEVSEFRRKRGLSREEQREELRQVSDVARGHKIYRPEHTDSLNHDGILPITHTGDDRSPISGRIDARSYSRNEKVVIGASNSATPVDLFISPSTGREYTKKEVYGLAHSDLKLFRQLIKKDQNRLNRILGN